MSGRSALPRTRFTRVACSDPGVTVIRISGSLGPRAKPQLVRLTQECLRRNLPRLVLDLSEVDALGGGTARLLNEFATERGGRGGKTAFRVTSRTVRGFLCADSSLSPPPLVASLDEAVVAVRGGDPSPAPEPQSRAAAPGARDKRVEEPPAPRDFDPPPRQNDKPLTGANALFAPELDDVVPPVRFSNSRGQDPEALEIGADDFPDDDGEILDLDLDDVVEEPLPPLLPPRDTRPEELRDRLVTALGERDIAARVFLFQRHPDRRYYLVTRQGVDLERALDTDGGLASSVASLSSPGFLIDFDTDALSSHEVELMAELNCEVATPLGNSERPEYLVFMSKEKPGEEYTLEELQELEVVLESFGGQLARNGSKTTAEPPAAVAATETQATTATASVLRAEVDADIPEPPAPAAEGTPGALRNIVIDDADPVAPIRVPDRVDPSPRRVTTPDATRALRRNLAQMRDILSLSQDFDAGFGSTKLLEVLVLAVVSVARVETVLYFASRDGDYRLTHQRGMAPDAIQGLRLRGDASLVQRALASIRGICIGDDAQITEEERIWARQHGLHYAIPFLYKEETIGLLLLGENAEGSEPDFEMLGYLLAQAGLAYDRARLYETLQDRTLGVVRGLITLIEARNGFDCGSTEQVVRYTQALARELQFPTDTLRDLVYGAVLRDVGMLQVNESLLRSPADLTGDQWEAIRRHPTEGASIMRQMRFSPIAVDVVLHHHESYNGEGYPMGLRGRAIPLGARIVAVAESYVKMTMDRPYRKALGKAEALESLAENWGLRYDPLVVDALVRVVNRELSMGLKGDRDLARDLFGV